MTSMIIHLVDIPTLSFNQNFERIQSQTPKGVFCYDYRMSSMLIIIRGNSGSGKTTIAKALREKLGSNTMLLSEDVIRREILKSKKDDPNNPTAQLIEDMALYGNAIGYDVIVEGILNKKKYGDMLNDLTRRFHGQIHIFYFDILFTETLRRHGTKPNANEFGEKEMREWWKEKDYLDINNEKYITSDMTPEETLDFIYSAVQ